MIAKDAARAYVQEISEMLRGVTIGVLGYPPGDNSVVPPSPRWAEMSSRLPMGIRVLYEVCNGISMPDVHVGYFVYDVARTSESPARGEPCRVAGIQGEVLVFGSDGGGGRFAIVNDSRNDVYYLPSSGSVLGSVFEFLSANEAPVVVATGIEDFLFRLRGDVDAFLSRNRLHAYIAR